MLLNFLSLIATQGVFHRRRSWKPAFAIYSLHLQVALGQVTQQLEMLHGETFGNGWSDVE